MQDMDKCVDRILMRAVEILETCGWTSGSKRVSKSNTYRVWEGSSIRYWYNPEQYWYCPLGAIEQAASEILGIKIDKLNAYCEPEAINTSPSAMTVYRWNDGLHDFRTKRKERSNSKTPARVLRVMRKAAKPSTQKEGRTGTL